MEWRRRIGFVAGGSSLITSTLSSQAFLIATKNGDRVCSALHTASLPGRVSFVAPRRVSKLIPASQFCGSRKLVVRRFPFAEASRAVCSISASAEPSELEKQVLKQLSRIQDPDLGKDIVAAGFIKELTINDQSGTVTFTLELTTPACPIKDQFKADAESYVGELPWVKSVTATLSASTGPSPFQQASNGLKKVATILAVSSCKGGVGKSTVAVNLAYTLKKLGAKVGIMDADIYGPSLPVMVSPVFEQVEYNADNLIVPLEYEGVKLMSFGFVQRGGQAAVMRGPIVSNVLNQLLTTTDWGELDYLVVDMPPGTGDIQLTLCQLVNITAAVIVTTPQKLSFIDVVKGIQMFDKVNVPCVAVVENMSYFICNHGERYEPFGRGARDKLVKQFGIQNTFTLPISEALSASSDTGRPFILQHPDSEAASEYASLGASVVQEISKIKFSGVLDKPEVTYEAESNILDIKVPGARSPLSRGLNPADVRRKCKCAACVDEYTQAQILLPEMVSESIKPLSILPVGNYAVSIQWSDGHPSLFPYKALLDIEPRKVTEATAAAV